MFANIKNALPAGVALDAESWVAVKTELATQYIIRFVIGIALAAVVLIALPGLPDAMLALDLPPHFERGSYMGGAFLVAVFWVWCALSVWDQRDTCLGAITADDPIRHAARARRRLYWWVALFMNGYFAYVLAITGPLSAMILVVPALIGPAFLAATTGAEYYARHAGTEDAKAVCRTVFRSHVMPCMVAAAAIFTIGVVIVFAVFGH